MTAGRNKNSRTRNRKLQQRRKRVERAARKMRLRKIRRTKKIKTKELKLRGDLVMASFITITRQTAAGAELHYVNVDFIAEAVYVPSTKTARLILIQKDHDGRHRVLEISDEDEVRAALGAFR